MQSLKTAKSCVGICEAKMKMLQLILSRHWRDQVFVFVASTADVCKVGKLSLAYPIAADIKRVEREMALKQFSEGKVRAIVSCKVLNEGIDVPSASVAVILGGTGQPREHIQRIGRVLRKSPDKKAVIYELIAKNTFEQRKSSFRNASM